MSRPIRRMGGWVRICRSDSFDRPSRNHQNSHIDDKKKLKKKFKCKFTWVYFLSKIHITPSISYPNERYGHPLNYLHFFLSSTSISLEDMTFGTNWKNGYNSAVSGRYINSFFITLFCFCLGARFKDPFSKTRFNNPNNRYDKVLILFKILIYIYPMLLYSKIQIIICFVFVSLINSWLVGFGYPVIMLSIDARNNLLILFISLVKWLNSHEF